MEFKMKTLTLSIAGLLVAGIFQGCSTPKTAGLDSAYLNKNRGAKGAQITAAEARQYRRQQALSADEIRLENMKRRQQTDAIQENASAANSAVDAVRNVKSLLGGF